MSQLSQGALLHQTWWAVAATLLLAPAAAELLTSSAPPAIFFRPSVLPLFVLLYGAGALLAREMVIRWKKGWPSLLLLGASYGVIEEGLCAKSFFDPNWRALGPLGHYGSWGGVNWIWTLGLTLFHAVFSIGLTILCVYLLFPRIAERVWLGRIPLFTLALLFFLDVVLFIQKGNPYHVPRAYSVVSLGIALLFVALARLWPTRDGLPLQPARRAAIYFGALGFVTSAAFIALLYIVPLLKPPVSLTAALLLGLALVSGTMLMRWTDRGRAWDSLQKFGLVAGIYGFFAFLAPVQDFNPGRPDKASGMTAVGIAAILGLVLFYRRLKGRRPVEEAPVTG